MALRCESSGTCATRRFSWLCAPSSQARLGCYKKAQSRLQAVAGRVHVPEAVQSLNHPAIPRLRDLLFGSTNPNVEHEEQTASTATAATCRIPDISLLPQWAQRCVRQVPALPSGRHAMYHILSSVEHLRARVANCDKSCGVVDAYLHLALVDVVMHCWQERMQELTALELRVQQGSSNMSELKQQMQDALLALSGCRYLRLEAVKKLAHQVHLLVDECGHQPELDFSSLPQPHTTGINFPQLLQQGLGVDLQNPAVRVLSESEAQALQNLTWEHYHVQSQNTELVGEWCFCFWSGHASLVAAPYGKFSTAELAALLTPELVLSSLPNGVVGRALVAAAIEVGVVLDCWAEPTRVMEGAGHVGSASAWMFFESQFGVQDNMQKVRQLALAVAATAVTMMQQQQQH